MIFFHGVFIYSLHVFVLQSWAGAIPVMCGALAASCLSTTWALPCFRYNDILLLFFYFDIDNLAYSSTNGETNTRTQHVLNWQEVTLGVICKFLWLSVWHCTDTLAAEAAVIKPWLSPELVSLSISSSLLLNHRCLAHFSFRLMTTGSIWPWWRES